MGNDVRKSESDARTEVALTKIIAIFQNLNLGEREVMGALIDITRFYSLHTA